MAVEDRDIWALIQAIHAAEVRFFGQRVTHDHDGQLELKAKKLLKAKVFRLARAAAPMEEASRTELARSCLLEGAAAKAAGREAKVTAPQLAALGQAKLAFVQHVLELLSRSGARAIASIVDVDSPRPQGDFLRKDYAYLFERFYYLLDEHSPRSQGLVVFDEVDKTRCHVLVNQMRAYFVGTAVGRLRASRIVPEPLFVHSDLTTMVQVADLVSYVIVWGVRVAGMDRPVRPELAPFVRAVMGLRHHAMRERAGQPFFVWSFAVIDDLRSRAEREEEEEAAEAEGAGSGE